MEPLPVAQAAPAQVEVVAAAPVQAPAAVVAAAPATVVTAAAVAPSLAASAPIVIPAPVHDKAALHAIVQSAGLNWVETDPERVARAMANQSIVPIKLGRERKPPVVISDVPLVQVETRT